MKKRHVLAGLVTGLAVGGLTGILFAPKAGKETRKDLKKVYSKVSKDVIDKIKEVKDLTKEKYHEIVDKAISEYQKIEKVTKEQVAEVATILKDKWKDIEKK